MLQVIFVSLLAAMVFGTIDALNYLFIEDELTGYLKRWGFENEDVISLIDGGISAAIAIFFATYLENVLHQHIDILKHPAIDSFGIILGTIMVIFMYKFFTKYIKKS